MNRASTLKAVLWLLLSALSAGSMAFYVVRIWSTNQTPHFSDFYAPWWGAHELLLHGRDPYSPAVAHEIQTVIYGAPAHATSNDPANIAGGFAYPPYAALLLWPTLHMPFADAQKLFLTVSVLAVLLSLTLWLRAFRFRFSIMPWLTIALFVLGSFPALQGMKLENLSLIAAAFVALTFFFLAADHLVLAGIFLALSTFKPQFTLGLIVWLALWIASDWRHRRPLAWSFSSTLLLLVLISEWLIPGWIPQFLNVLRAYRQYTYGHSLFDVWFTPRWGWVVAAIFLIASLALAWRHREQPSSSLPFLIVTSLMLAVTLLVIPTLAPHAQLLLLPGFLCMLRGQSSLAKVRPRLILGATWIILAWQWIATFGFFAASQWVSLPTLLRFWAVPLYTSPLLPLTAAATLGLLTTSFVRNRTPGDSG